MIQVFSLFAGTLSYCRHGEYVNCLQFVLLLMATLISNSNRNNYRCFHIISFIMLSTFFKESR